MVQQPIYLHLNPSGAPTQLRQPESSRVVLVSEASTSQSFKESMARELVQGGCLYFMAWGSECESWHDAVDMANIQEFDFEQIPEDRFIMTTWHESEPLDEVLWFCKNSAFHSVASLERVILIQVSQEPREKGLLQQYAAA